MRPLAVVSPSGKAITASQTVAFMQNGFFELQIFVQIFFA